MLDRLRRFWQERVPRPCSPCDTPPIPGDKSSTTAPRPPRVEFAFTSIDVGNYA